MVDMFRSRPRGRIGLRFPRVPGIPRFAIRVGIRVLLVVGIICMSDDTLLRGSLFLAPTGPLALEILCLSRAAEGRYPHLLPGLSGPSSLRWTAVRCRSPIRARYPADLCHRRVAGLLGCMLPRRPVFPVAHG